MFDAQSWHDIELVVFDVDGTIYNQRILRRKMMLELLAHCLAKRSCTTIRVISTLRSLQERMSEEMLEDFLPHLIMRTAARIGVSEATVKSIREEWIERRPLRHLAACRYPGVEKLFDGLKKRKLRVAIFSDYPAVAKVAALGLTVDDISCAEDSGVGILKPHPEGLLQLIERAGVRPKQTLMIGDRVDRDGEAAIRAGTHCLIRSKRPCATIATFRYFNDPIFAEFIASEPP
ncbi:MAG: HAD family hydrolase [Deltaproteobacteria bacterium]|nr:HAD family hydrolase [Deltaproteobacteria bacterium]